MPIEEEPIVGATYEDEEGRSFAVISFDEDEGTIEVKFEDETVNEIDLDAWYEMELKRIATPKDEDDEEEDDIEEEDEDDDDFDDDEDDEDDDLDDDDDEA